MHQDFHYIVYVCRKMKKILYVPTYKNDKSVQIEIRFALAFLFILGPNNWNHSQHFGHKNHRTLLKIKKKVDL